MTRYPGRLLTRVLEPSLEPVSLDEAKLYLRIDTDDENTLIGSLIAAARVYAEQYLAMSLMPQGWKLAFDDAAPQEVQLPMGPLQTIESVEVTDRAGAVQLVPESNYFVNAAEDTLVFIVPPYAHHVSITYATGFGAADDVPPPIRQGMLCHITSLYERRGEGQAMLPAECTALYAPFRRVRL